jgi:cell division protein FtsL
MSPRALPRGSRPGLGAEIVLVALAFAALGVFHVWSRTRVLAAGYELGELQKQHAELVAAHDALRIELEMVRSTAKLEEAVRTRLARLGMAPPDRGAVLAAGPGGPLDGLGRAGVDGVGDPSRPAGSALYTAPVTAPGRAAAAGSTAAPGEKVALRGPLRAGRAAPREP